MAECSRSRFLPALLFLTGTNAWCAGPVFNILDYGARNDGSASATAAFRSAIQAAKAVGGGTVFVPAGKYVTGPIQLVSNLTLNIDAGATLRFQPTSDMPLMKGRAEGTEAITPVPLIGGSNLENVSITGRGSVLTLQSDWQMFAPMGAGRGVWGGIVQRLNLKQPVPLEDFQKAALFFRPVSVGYVDSKNVLIEGIHIMGSVGWTVHILYSDKVVIRNVVIETFDPPGRDGIDIDSCRDVMISNCYLDTGDDNICLKSGRDADGLRGNRPTENVTITNCVMHRGHGGVAIGSETSGGIRNVAASNIVCRGTERGIRIKSTRGRGAVIENLRFDNWTMEDVPEAIHVTGYYSFAPQEPVSERTPVFRDIAISNMTIKNSHQVANIEGLPESPMSGLRISDVIASGRNGIRAFNTVALELHNVQVNAARGPAFLIRDAKDLELDGVSTRQPLAGMPVIRLDHCPGAIVRGSRAFAGTGTFLSVAAGELKSVALTGNTLAGARKAAEQTATDYWGTPVSAAPASARAPSADIGGKWVADVLTRMGGSQLTTFTFKVDGGKLLGTVATRMGEREISEGKVSGNEITFAIVEKMRDAAQTTVYKGTAAGSEIQFACQLQMPPGGMGGFIPGPPVEFTAKRGQ